MLLGEMHEACNADGRLRAHVLKLQERSRQLDEGQARSFVRDLVVGLQAALLIRHSTSDVADAFSATRLSGDGGAFGFLSAGTNVRAIVDRAAPAVNKRH
ncbi:MAG: DNA alkylation response protein, partial [Proteobacteria bacterium]|nr:DNA alkylation response protein [Pseudomonadota bacterium]